MRPPTRPAEPSGAKFFSLGESPGFGGVAGAKARSLGARGTLRRASI